MGEINFKTAYEFIDYWAEKSDVFKAIKELIITKDERIELLEGTVAELTQALAEISK